MISLRNRLLLLIGLAEVILVVGAFWLSYDKGKHEAEELLDGQLILSMRLLEAQIHHDSHLVNGVQSNGAKGNGSQTNGAQTNGVQTAGQDGQARQGKTDASPYAALIELIDDADRGEYEPELAFSVWDAAQRKVLRSNNAADMPRLDVAGFNDLEMDGRAWRSYGKFAGNGSYLIQVAHPMDRRYTVGFEVAERITYPMLFALPLLMIAIYYAIQISLRPVRRLAKTISQRTGMDTQPIDTAQVLPELRPVIEAFNELLGKVETSRKHERQFTADAAHELRSPLAGIKIQAQLAWSAPDDTTKRAAIGQVLAGVQRSERLVEQLLRLARLDPDQAADMEMAPVHLRYLMLEALDLTQTERDARSQKTELECDEDLCVQGDNGLLLVALVNVLGNAVKYSPPETTIHLQAKREGATTTLTVWDEGAGIPESEISEITKRFRRVPGTQGQGSGLGLAIVERIAELHHAELGLSNRTGAGLQVMLRFKAKVK